MHGTRSGQRSIAASRCSGCETVVSHKDRRCVYLAERNLAVCPMGKTLYPSFYRESAKRGCIATGRPARDAATWDDKTRYGRGILFNPGITRCDGGIFSNFSCLQPKTGNQYTGLLKIDGMPGRVGPRRPWITEGRTGFGNNPSPSMTCGAKF
jgi:hypothetical protein